MYHSFRSQWLFGMSPYHQCRPCCSVLLHLSLSMIYLIPSSTAFNDAYSYCPRLTERLRICLGLCQRRPSLDWSLGLTSGYDCTGYPGWEGPAEALVTLLWNCEDAFFFLPHMQPSGGLMSGCLLCTIATQQNVSMHVYITDV